MALLLMLGIEHGPVITTVILDLQGVRADQDLGRANEGSQSALIALQHLVIPNLSVEIFGNVGDAFDPNIHNAVMHTEDAEVAENTITQVFQKGFKIGDKVVRFAMVQVAN